MDARQQLVLRLREAAGSRNNREIGEALGFSPETVRRYMTGVSPPCVAFVIALCERFGVSADWLVLGAGPMSPGERDLEALRRASAAALFARVAELVEPKGAGAPAPPHHGNSDPTPNGSTGPRLPSRPGTPSRPVALARRKQAGDEPTP